MKLLKNLLYAGLSTLLIGCGGGGGGRNQPPAITDVKERFFPNNGTVEYNIIAEDFDGAVKRVYVTHNKKTTLHPYREGEINIISKLITNNENTLDFVVEDNIGGRSSKVRDTFRISDKNEAYDSIDRLLSEERTRSQIKDYVGDRTGKRRIFLNDEEIQVMFELTLNDDTFALIAYIDAKDDLNNELENEKLVNDFKINNLYLFRLPKEEIERRMEAFAQKRFKSFD